MLNFRTVPLVLVLSLCLPLVVRGDAEQPEAVNVRVVFGWIPQEHRFSVANGRVTWDVETAQAATDAVFRAKNGAVIQTPRTTVRVTSSGAATADITMRLSERIDGVTYQTSFHARVPIDMVGRWSNNQGTARMQGAVHRINYSANDRHATSVIELRQVSLH